MRHIFVPWKRYHSVCEISLPALQEAGIGLILLDRDNTVFSRTEKKIPSEVARWIAEAKKAGFILCLVSNNIHADQIARTAEALSVAKKDHAMKPLPTALKKAAQEAGVAPSAAVMVGDQVYTDIVAGNLAGMKTILVDPLSKKEIFYTYFLRVFERFFLRSVPYTSAFHAVADEEDSKKD